MNSQATYILTDGDNGLVRLLRDLPREGYLGEDRIDSVVALIQELVAGEEVQPELSRQIGFAASFGVGAGLPDSVACAAWLVASGQTQDLAEYSAQIWASRAAHQARADAWARNEPAGVAQQAFHQAWCETLSAMLDLYDSIAES